MRIGATRATLGLVLLLTLTGSAGADVGRAPASGAIGERAHRDLAISGRVQGLHPGAAKRMWVTVRNRAEIDLRVVTLRASATSVDDACPPSMLRVRRLRSAPLVPARDEIRVRMRVRLRPSAPDACQGMRFPIVFRATAVPA